MSGISDVLQSGSLAYTQPTPASVAARRALAQQLLQTTQIKDAGPLGALANTIGGLGSGYETGQAMQEEQQGQNAATEAIARTLQSPDPSFADLAGVASNPWLNQNQSGLVNALLGKETDLAYAKMQPGYGQQILQPGDVIRDATTGQLTPIGGRPPIAVYPGTQLYDPNTRQFIDGAAGMDNNGAPLGTTGNAAIDPTVDGYSSKPVGGTGGLTQAAIDQRALNYITSGGTPPVGRTGLAGIQNTAISNRMAELDPNGNLAANKTQLKALSSSLTKQQTYLDQTERSISNAENGFQQIVTAFQGKVNPSNFPTVNAAINAVAGQTDPGTISAFRSGLQEVANEYTQVFSRGGQVTDSVRNRANDILNGNLSIPQLKQVLDELQAQGDIVIQGAKDQIAKINDQIAGLAHGQSSGSSSQGVPASTDPGIDDLLKKYGQ